MASEYLDCQLKDLVERVSRGPGSAEWDLSLRLDKHSNLCFIWCCIKDPFQAVKDWGTSISYYGLDKNQTLRSVIEWAQEKGIILEVPQRWQPTDSVRFELSYRMMTQEERIAALLEKSEQWQANT